jgi:1-deoxy-D-xylulose-5-phosphate synthase
LDNVDSPEYIKKLSPSELEKLSLEIRMFLIKKVSKTGGHLASNLGVVELTIALHRVFSTPKDRIIWDVGHQSYVHKLITGRKDLFDGLRQLGGISGFPKLNESEHDCFNTGHSSTSISAALGIARARDIKGEDYSVIAVIGDGALTGGMSFEALNDAGRSNNNLIVILNDNQMSISKNVGGMSRYLGKIRTQPRYLRIREDIDSFVKKIPLVGNKLHNFISRIKRGIKFIIMPQMIFEELGFKYVGPINGHSIPELTDVLNRAKQAKGPVFIHICTQKGRGYQFAEEKPQIFHGMPPFEIETGEILNNKGKSYSSVFGDEIIKLAKNDNRIVAITASMPQGTGLDKFAKTFPMRFFDVGIAEQHAVTFSAGLACNGLKPVLAMYSSFMQRAYDQILHDVAMQNLNVVFAVDRAGIVGRDGETHQGIYDISFLNHIPNMTIMAPADFNELREMLDYALTEHKGPIAIRYPKGGSSKNIESEFPGIKLGKGECIKEGKDVTIAAIGDMVEIAVDVSEILKENGIDAEIINARFIKPLDEELIIKSINKTGLLFTIENSTEIGGFGNCIIGMLDKKNIVVKHKIFAYPDEFITQGSRRELATLYHLDPQSISEEILKIKNNEK